MPRLLYLLVFQSKLDHYLSGKLSLYMSCKLVDTNQIAESSMFPRTKSS